MRRALVLATLVVAASLSVPVAVSGQQGGVISVATTTTPDRPTPDQDVTVRVNLTNPTDDQSYNVGWVALHNTTDPDSTMHDRVKPTETLSGGESVSYELTMPVDETGTRQGVVHIFVDTLHGDTYTFTRNVSVTAVQPHPALSLSTSPVGPDGRTDVSLSLSNGLSEEIRGVSVELSGQNSSLTLDEDRRVRSSVSAGNETTMTFPASDADPGRQTFEANLTYITESGQYRTVTRSLSTTVDPVENPANLTLTGVRVTEADGHLTVRGSASNLGGGNATGAMVSVGDSGAVDPAQSQSRFFVGEVPASDFSSFEVHATTTANGTVTVPLNVSYVVDDTRVTSTTTVTFTPNETDTEQPSTRQSALPVPPLAAGGALVVVLFGVVGWRRLRG
ncbi:hypothetical protein ACFQL1_04495 [Halomicroarcula sp. GCM10025709]|uniref:hypothetical protein n=1 Tax=Haloarcula TaxID=2237 RepID=UPI0024C2AE33|nr:hypothetical protein [Halomicroarcula sp. YJ-61-S]